jgi:hypothetical protein
MAPQTIYPHRDQALRLGLWAIPVIGLVVLAFATWPFLKSGAPSQALYSPQVAVTGSAVLVTLMAAVFGEYRDVATRRRREETADLLVARELTHLSHQLKILARPGHPRIGSFDFPAIRRCLDITAEVRPELRGRLAPLVYLLSEVETLLARCLANPAAILFRQDLQRAAEIAFDALEPWQAGAEVQDRSQ